MKYQMWECHNLRAEANTTASTTQRKSNSLAFRLAKVDISGETLAVGKICSWEGTIVDGIANLLYDVC
jgi:hypothetical protein